MAQVILFNVTNGLIIGAFYVLMALGLSLILNLSNVINFAHGNFLAPGWLSGVRAVARTGILGRASRLAAAHGAGRRCDRAADDPPHL